MSSTGLVYYGRRWMKPETAQLYRDYKAACAELTDYRLRGEVHPALSRTPEPEPARPSILTSWAALIIYPALGFAGYVVNELGGIMLLGAAIGLGVVLGVAYLLTGRRR